MMFNWLLILILSCCLPLLAKPKGHAVKHGQCTIEDLQQHLKVHQHTDKAIVYWDQFSIEQGEIAEFFQPNAGSAVLNRVVGKNPSEIYGMLKGNGKVFLINQNGVLIGPTGQIRTNGFVASALDVANAEFLEGKDLHFSGSSDAKVQNLGTIESKQGSIYLIAKRVENPGNVETSGGQAYLLGGTDVYLSSDEMTVRVQGEGTAESTGVIEATQIEIRSAGGNISQLAINLDGVLQATGTQEINGRVLLSTESGIVEAGGEIVAHGGSVHLLGSEVTLDRPLTIDVAHSSGNGEVFIGGNPQSNLPLANAVYVGPEVKIYADAHDQGNGGTVIAYAKEKTAFHGEAFARALGDHGDGGFIEVSSKGDFEWGKSALAHRESKNGKPGLLLWDPPTVTVDDAMAASISTNLGCGPVSLVADDSVTFTNTVTPVAWSQTNTLTVTSALIQMNANTSIQSTATGSFTAVDFQGTGTGKSVFIIYIGGGTISTMDGAVNLTASGTTSVFGPNSGISIIVPGSGNFAIDSLGSGPINIHSTLNSPAFGATAVYINGNMNAIRSHGGDIKIFGENSSVSNETHGIEIFGNALIQGLNNANITLTGIATNATTSGAGTSTAGIFFQEAQVQSVDGSIMLRGVCESVGVTADGIGLFAFPNQVIASGSGNITMVGIGSQNATDSRGINLTSGTNTIQVNNGRLTMIGEGGNSTSGKPGIEISGTQTIEATGSGAIFMSGLGAPAGPDAHGVYIHSGPTVQVNSGSLFLDGVARANGESGLCIENGGTVVQSIGSGGITLNGVGIGSGPGIKTTAPIGSASTGGPITFRADTMSIGANVQGTDLLRIENLTPTQPMNIGDGTPMTGLHISNAELAFFVPGFTEIIFGTPPPGRQEVTIDSGGVLAFTEPVRFRGGTINVLNPISSPGNQVIFNIGQNSGGVLNLNAAVTASNVIALGSFSDDIFNINASQAMFINGGDGLNTLNAPNFRNQWTIIGNDAGVLSKGPINFINVGSLTGGLLADYFTFQDQATLSGLLNGGAPAASNTLDLTQYTSPFLIEFTSPTSGNASMIQLGFINIGTELEQNILVPTGPMAKLVFFPDQLIPIFSNQMSLSFLMLEPSRDDPWTLLQRYLLGVINGYDMRGMNWGVINNARVNYRKKGAFDSNIFETKTLHNLFRGRQPRDFRMNAASAAPF